MVKAPWNRNRNRPTVNVPNEVEEYYQSTQNEKRGVTWLLSLATLALTLLIAGAVFFGVKWAYNKFTAKDTGSASVNQPEDITTPITNNSDSNSTNDSSASNTDSSNQDANQPSVAPNSNSSSSNQPANNTQPTTPAPNTNIHTTPITGPETPEIPRTGPTGND